MRRRILSAILASAMCSNFIVPGSAQILNTTTSQNTERNQNHDLVDSETSPGRQIQNFNRGWSFHLGDADGAEAKDYDDSDWRVLNLPHDYSIENDFNLDSEAQAGGGFLDGGPAWYRKSFVIPASMADKRITIDFGGVYMNSDVYVNGQHVGNYPYGYSSFSYDITDYIIADGMTKNVIAVYTNNQQPSSRWYSGSGIYRDVQLTFTDPIHVERNGTKVTTPNLESEYTNGTPVTVNVDTILNNDGSSAGTVTLEHTIYFDGSLEQEGSTSPVATVITSSVDIQPNAEQTVSTVLEIPDPVLWQVGVGGMYRLHTKVLQDGKVIDDYETPFGLRWMKFDPQNGFFLNGEYTKMRGVCQHHDQGALGAVNNPAALDRQIRILREMGVNAIRSSHNPASRALLDACNEQGIMVMEEAFDCWWSPKNNYDFHQFFDTPCTHPDAEEGQTWQEFDIKNMVNEAKNDPCVIMWSIGNEIGESWSGERAVEVGSQLREWVKEVDDTRAVTQADPIFYQINKPAYDPANNEPHWQLINGHDAMGFNYGKYTDYDYVHEMNPDWFIYSSETSSAVSTRGSYFHPEVDADPDASLHQDTFQCSEFDNDHVNWGTTLHYALREDAKRKYMGGLFFWTGFDYIGEPAPFAGGSSKSSYFGAIDTCGFPKESYYLIQSQWLDVKTDPMVHILPHWNWENDDSIEIDGKMPIRVYSNAPKVEVFLNGESLGVKEFTLHPETETSLAYQDDGTEQENLYLQWLVEYEPGTVEAVAYDENGNEIARDVNKTAGDPAALKLMPERMVIEADGEDLCYIPVDVVDENGEMNPWANVPIQFTISGNGRIVGTDNGDPTDFTNMKSTQRSSFHGKALVIVQSKEKGGSFTLTATAPGLKSDSVTVYTAESGTPDGTLLGYDPIELSTPVNQAPSLPKTVTAVYMGGSTKQADVTWDEIPAENLSQAGIFTVYGTVNQDGTRVVATIEVVAPVGVKPVSAVTQPGVQPNLPKEVILVSSDGTEESHPVTWARIPEKDLVDGAEIKVLGVLKDREELAKAFIRVSAMQQDINVARAVPGSEYPKFTASHTSQYDPLEHVNDGIISFGTNPKNGWGNWLSIDEFLEVTTLDLELESPQELNRMNIYFREDDGIYIPKKTILKYWDEEQGDWTPVKNQSATGGFHTNEGSLITFDSVETKKLRAEFTRGTQDTTHGKKDCLVLTEVEVYSTQLDAGSDIAVLDSLQVGGQTIDGFDPEKTLYTVTLPYGAPVPEVTASAADRGTVFVLPAISNHSSTRIEVFSESGKVSKTYYVQFQETPAAITSANLRLEQETVHEDDTLPIYVDAKLESGALADESDLKVRYEVLDAGVPAKAAVENGVLYAYGAGTVQIKASVSYLGKTVESAPLTVTIQPSDELKTILSYAQLTINTSLGQPPKLPDTVRATFDIGLSKDVAVTWDPIDPAQYANYGSFVVRGTVENQALHPFVTVLVRDGASAKNVSVATPVGVKPTLPATTTIYYTDGTTTASAVTWEPFDMALTKSADTIFTVNGTTQIGNFPVTASVRVTSDTIRSENHAKNRNGCPYSMAITSFSEGGSAVTLNDGLTNKWTDWGNPKDDVWVGIIFGADYPELRYVDTVVMDLLKDSDWERTKIEDVTVEYYTKPVTLEDVPKNVANFDNPEFANHPFNITNNWKEVKNLKQPKEWDYGENTLTFDMVQTYAIRIKTYHDNTGITDPNKTHYIALRELYAYGKQAKAYTDFTVTGLSVDGVPQTDFDPTVKEYTANISGLEIPELTLQVNEDENPSVSYVPANDLDSAAKFIVTSEDGLKSETYTIHFQSDVARYPVHVTNGAAYRAGKEQIQLLDDAIQKYAAGEKVVLVADAPSAGMAFDHWEFEGDVPADADVKQNPTTITMPNHEVKVTAVYAERELTDAEAVAAAKIAVGDGVEIPYRSYANEQEQAEAATKMVQENLKNGVTATVSYEEDHFVLRLKKGNAGTTVNPFQVTVAKPSSGGGGGSSSKPENPTKPPIFNDVPNDVWYYEAVSYVTKHGLMTGVGEGNFAPHSPLSRAMLTQILYSAAGKPAVSGNAFDDVPNGQWYTDSVNWAAQNGIVGGYGDGIFAPNDNITREQLALMLYGFGKLQGLDVSAQGDLNSFQDADEVSSWAGEALLWAHGAGLISGKENSRLDPKGQATRAEAAQMIQNFMELTK